MIFEFTTHLVEFVESLDDADRLYGRFDDGSMSSCNCLTKIEFHREAVTLETAIRSAIADIEPCGFHVARVSIDETDLIQTINAALRESTARQS
jgi:hypothetical protein